MKNPVGEGDDDDWHRTMEGEGRLRGARLRWCHGEMKERVEDAAAIFS